MCPWGLVYAIFVFIFLLLFSYLKIILSTKASYFMFLPWLRVSKCLVNLEFEILVFRLP
jgi:hypothetical protein